MDESDGYGDHSLNSKDEDGGYKRLTPSSDEENIMALGIPSKDQGARLTALFQTWWRLAP